MQHQYELDAEYYHGSDSPTYLGETDGSYKVGCQMATVRYHAAHYNPQAPSGLHGDGLLVGKWLFNEEQGKAEGLLQSGIELMMDSRLEPMASLGLHHHHTTEEIYYLLEGSLLIRLFNDDEHQIHLKPGDAHRICPGESHFVQAGETGARFIVVAAKVEPGKFSDT